MLLRGGSNPQGFGKEFAIEAVGLFDGFRHIGDEPAHPPVVLLAVGKKQQFVAGMEIHQGPTAGGCRPQVTEMFKDEDAFNEVFPQSAVVESAILLNRQEGEVASEGPGEHAGANIAGHALLRIDLDPVQAAARRVLFKNEAAEVLLLQLPHPFLSPGLHLFGMVDTAAAGHQPGGILAAHQA